MQTKRLLLRIAVWSIACLACFQESGMAQGSLFELRDLNFRTGKLVSSTSDSALILSGMVIDRGAELLSAMNDPALSDSIRKEIMKAHGYAAQVHCDRGSYSEMMAHYLEAQELAEQTGDTVAAIESTSGIGSAYRYLHDRKRALFYFREALEKSRRARLDLQESKAMNLIGGAYADLSQHDSAIHYFEKSLVIKIRLADTLGIARIYNNLGVVFSGKNDHVSALNYFLNAAAWMRLSGEPFSLGVIYTGIADEYRHLRKWDMAQSYLDTATVIATQTRSAYLLQLAYYGLSQLNAARGDFRSAYHYQSLHKEITDSIRSENEQQEIADLKNRFELAQKELALARLSGEKTAAEADLRQQKIIRNAVLVLGFMAVLFMGAVLVLRRRKQLADAAAREAEFRRRSAVSEMQALRAQMNTHFIFNTLQSIYEYMLQHQTDKAGRYLLKFSKLIRMVLNMSRQSLVNLDEELEALELYTELENMHMNNPFSVIFEKNIPERTEGIRIPPLLLQPLVENSIRYGLSGNVLEGELYVLIEKQNDNLHCVVKNKGVGDLPHVKTDAAHSGSLGLKIISERLELLGAEHPEKAKLMTRDLSDPGNRIIAFCSEITIPDGMLQP